MEVIIDHLSKHYGHQKAVDDVSFSVKTGEVLGFLGPNGAGKTTTMKMLTCYISPTSGDATIDGKSIRQFPDEVKRSIGYLPEHNPLYLDMPIVDYLAFAGALQGLTKSVIPGRIREMIDVCGLGKERHKKIGELSKGYRQRVGLAQAMIHDPELLILDEPTTGLDPNQIVEIRKLIKEIGREKTVILSTHILPEVEATCDRILIINGGKIVADGTAENLRKQAQGKEILRVRIPDAPKDAVVAGLREIASVELVDPLADAGLYEVQSKPEQQSARNVFQACVDKQWVMTELTPSETKLEDIFRNLTTN